MSHERHHRRSVRLPGYDYRQEGAYFITVCVQGRERLFGHITDGEMRLNVAGQIVSDEWLRTPLVRPYVTLDAFVIMPNHLHAILFLDGTKTDEHAGVVGATWQVAPTKHANTENHDRPKGPLAHSLGAIVGQFKRMTTIRINAMNATPSAKIWQRNYYEHIIRNDADLARIREYIATNPAQWETDALYRPASD